MAYLTAMSHFAPTALWPARDRTPTFRLVLALFAAPGVIASLFSIGAFLTAGMTEMSAAAVWRATMHSAATLSALVFAFTLTFGVAGIAVLWRFARRGVLAWALTGAAAGALAGVLFGELALSDVHRSVVTTGAVGGWALFLLIRRFAGVRDVPAPE